MPRRPGQHSPVVSLQAFIAGKTELHGDLALKALFLVGPEGQPGAITRLYAVWRSLKMTHPTVTRPAFMQHVWEALPEQFRLTMDGGLDHFIETLGRTLKPSVTTVALDLRTAEAAKALSAASAALLERYYGGVAAGWTSDQLRIVDIPTDLSTQRRIDKNWWVGRELTFPWLMSSDDIQISQQVANAVTSASTSTPIVLIGEPFSSKKSMVITALDQRINRHELGMPIYATSAFRNTRVAVETDIRDFLSSQDSSGDHGDLAAMARKTPAIYYFADVNLLADPAQRLISGDYYVDLARLLLTANPATRVIISSDVEGQGAKDKVRKRLERCLILESNEALSLRDLLEWCTDPDPSASDYRQLDFPLQGQASGTLVVLSALYLRLTHHSPAMQGEVFDKVLGFGKDIEGARKYLYETIVRGLRPKELQILALLCASTDGIRRSSLFSAALLANLGLRSQVAEVLIELMIALGSFLRISERGPWVDDDPPRGGESAETEPYYELNHYVRKHLILALEEYAFAEMRWAQLRIARIARRQGFQRRMNGKGLFGSQLDDLSRDIQAYFGLVASVDTERVADGKMPRSQVNLETEVFDGKVDAETTLKFAYLQLFKQDIDRDYRLHNEHDADELRLHMLHAVLRSAGKNYWSQPYRLIDADDIEAAIRIFGHRVVLEMLTSLSMSSLNAGDLELVDRCYTLGDLLMRRPDRPDLLAPEEMTKLWRTWIDAAVLSGGLSEKGRLFSSRPKLAHLEALIQSKLTLFETTDTTLAKQGRVKLLLRLGEVQHLMGKRTARTAFDAAERLEAVLEATDWTGRSLISGHGARREFRYLINLAQRFASGRKEFAPKYARRALEHARRIHKLSLRRLSRHASDRIGVVLDEARLLYTEGLHEESPSASAQLFRQARDWLTHAARSYDDHAVSLGSRIDICSLTGRIGLHMMEKNLAPWDNTEDMVRQTENAIAKLRVISDSYDVPMAWIYCRLLAARFALNRKSVARHHLRDLEDAATKAQNIGLGLYIREIDELVSRLSVILRKIEAEDA